MPLSVWVLFMSISSEDFNLLASQIRCVIFDVDGVLTDGSLFYGPNGEEIKKFHVKDGVGIKLLMKHEIDVAVISAKTSLALTARLDDLGIEHSFTGVGDKRSCYAQLLKKLSLTSEQVAYVGDDVIDLQVMSVTGLSIAVADAYPMVIDQADWVTTAKGGCGAAREVADLILQSRKDLEHAYKEAIKPSFEKKKQN